LKIISSSFSKNIFQKGFQFVYQEYKSEFKNIFFQKELGGWSLPCPIKV